MFPNRYFASGFFPDRYFPPGGGSGPSSIEGYRSLLAFWIGGASIVEGPPIPTPTPTPTPTPAPTPEPDIVYGGGGNYYDRVRNALKERREAELKLAENKRLEKEKRLELARKEEELARKRKLDIQANWLVNEINAINKELLLIEQQNILIRALINFWLQEEEDIYVILMSTL